MAAHVGTWHDDVSSPGLIACVPSGYRLTEIGRPRDDVTLLINHGGVCLLCDASLHMRSVPLPTSPTFEVICSYVNCSVVSALVAVVYRIGSVMQAFFDDFNDLLERMATYSTPSIIVSDLNIHECSNERACRRFDGRRHQQAV
jgi:hypothetical protein